MCGIVAVLADPACGAIYEALKTLQHRGQDAAGIVTDDEGRLSMRKDNGMVDAVFGKEHLAALGGSAGIGHCRYPTAGSSSCAEAQPFYVNSPFGIALAHNGNIVNTEALSQELRRELRHINTSSDSEVLLNVFAAALARSIRKRPRNSDPETEQQAIEDVRPQPSELLEAVRDVMRRCVGGYSVVVLVAGYGLVCFRDPNGIRPLSYGRRKPEGCADGAAGDAPWEWMVASESGTLNSLGFELVGDVQPGSALLLPRAERSCTTHDCLPSDAPARPMHAPCVFEYVYFARPDSVLDGVSVYRTRLRMGEKLAQNILRHWPDHDIDVVIPVPDTARTSALECAATLGLKYREGFIKNRYVGRTFIMPAQGLRKKSVRQKLSAIKSELDGRAVLLVDDSIVRGTTCSQIISMAREAGATKVYMASAAPPVLYPNVYGIDMPTKTELLAARHDQGDGRGPLMEDIAKDIGADRVVYQELPDLVASIVEEAKAQGSSLTQLDCSCFDGKYVTTLDGDYLEKLAVHRDDSRGNGSCASHLLDRLEGGSAAPARVPSPFGQRAPPKGSAAAAAAAAP